MALGKTYITCISDFFSISGSFYYLLLLSSYTILTIEVTTAPLSSLLKLDGPCGIVLNLEYRSEEELEMPAITQLTQEIVVHQLVP